MSRRQIYTFHSSATGLQLSTSCLAPLDLLEKNSTPAMMTGKSRALEFSKKLLRLFSSSWVTFNFHRTEPFNKPHDSCRFIYNNVVGNWLSENFFHSRVWSTKISHQKKEPRYFHLTTSYDFQHETLMTILGFPTLERPWEKCDTWLINLDPLFSLTVLFPWELAKHMISQQQSIYVGE